MTGTLEPGTGYQVRGTGYGLTGQPGSRERITVNSERSLKGLTYEKKEHFDRRSVVS